MNIEHGTFTPLVFSVSGRVGKECSISTNMTQKIANKKGERYEKIMSIIRCIYILSFLILRLCSMCIRGSRSLQKPERVDNFVIA